ncbi:hypothetical protein PV325_012364, partial [Microctonus aethiopoides]
MVLERIIVTKEGEIHDPNTQIFSEEIIVDGKVSNPVAQIKLTLAHSIQTPMRNSCINAGTSSSSGQQIASPFMINHLKTISSPSHGAALHPTSLPTANQLSNDSRHSGTSTSNIHMNENIRNRTTATAISTVRPDLNIFGDNFEPGEDDAEEDDAQDDAQDDTQEDDTQEDYAQDDVQED